MKKIFSLPFLLTAIFIWSGQPVFGATISNCGELDYRDDSKKEIICKECLQGFTVSEDRLSCARNSTTTAQTCVAGLKAERAMRSTSPTPPPLGKCESFYYASKIVGADMEDTDSKTSNDRAVTCVQKLGYTIDYDDCESVMKLYNYVLVAEKAMQFKQSAQQTINNNKTAQRVSQQTASGDGQTAAWDATIKTNKSLANMNKEQAAVYAAAVAALSNRLLKWKTPNAKGFAKFCAEAGQNVANLAKEFPTVQCPQALATAYGNSKKVVFANESAKAGFIARGQDFLAKGIAAGINAKNLTQNAQAMQSVSNSYEDTADTLENSNGNLISGSAYQGASFSGSPGLGNNDFTFGNETDSAFGEAGNPTTLGTVADIQSPFEDAAKEANSILDPSAAASVTPGGAAGGAGGGVGGGMGGGGGASLGDDLTGADKDEKKETDIKTTKYSGGYAPSGGGGFQGVKGSQDDSNPLGGLFDKSGGGIEEERGIASEDIAGQDSGLFQKISNRYAQMQAEKRIEANNLE